MAESNKTGRISPLNVKVDERAEVEVEVGDEETGEVEGEEVNKAAESAEDNDCSPPEVPTAETSTSSQEANDEEEEEVTEVDEQEGGGHNSNIRQFRP